MEHYLWLVPVGFVVGAYGTLIGAGGGFVLLPFLLILHPRDEPELLTSISLAVVFFNALSGTIAYARMGRIDYKSGILFSAATVPGALLGALSTAYIPRKPFDVALGLVMIAASVFLMVGTRTAPGDDRRQLGNLKRRLVETDGTVHIFAYNPVLGVATSLFVGYFSSVLGIGGGFIHVPVLANLLNFPVHVATATSHFVLAIMTLTGTLVHLFKGTFHHHGVHRTLALAAGVVIGAQVGARLSRRFHGPWIMRALAIALTFVGLRLLA